MRANRCPTHRARPSRFIYAPTYCAVIPCISRFSSTTCASHSRPTSGIIPSSSLQGVHRVMPGAPSVTALGHGWDSHAAGPNPGPHKTLKDTASARPKTAEVEDPSALPKAGVQPQAERPTCPPSHPHKPPRPTSQPVSILRRNIPLPKLMQHLQKRRNTLATTLRNAPSFHVRFKSFCATNQKAPLPKTCLTCRASHCQRIINPSHKDLYVRHPQKD